MQQITMQEIEDVLLKTNARMFISRIQGLWSVIIMRAPHIEVTRTYAGKLGDAVSLALMSANCDLENWWNDARYQDS